MHTGKLKLQLLCVVFQLIPILFFSYETGKCVTKTDTTILVETSTVSANAVSKATSKATDISNYFSGTKRMEKDVRFEAISSSSKTNCQPKANKANALVSSAESVSDARGEASYASERNIHYPTSAHPVLSHNPLVNFRQNNQHYGVPFNYTGLVWNDF